MAPILYKTDASPPVRSVYLTAKFLGVVLEHRELNIRNRDQLSPEFIKINPQHTVPTLDDNGFIIWDSHAINTYLVGKYGKDDSLYPKDLQKRALIDQRLHFDTALFTGLRNIVVPIFRGGEKKIPQEKIDVILTSYEFIDKFLEGHKWAAGDTITLADFSLIPTVTSLNLLVPIEAQTHPNIMAWIKRAEALPYYDDNKVGLQALEEVLRTVLA